MVQWIYGCEVFLVLDDIGKAKPEPSTSRLYSEYEQHIPPGSLSEMVLRHLLGSGRVRFVDRPPRQKSVQVQKICPKNKGDQAVLGAAAMSVDKLLISNDWKDFDCFARRLILKELSVRCVDSESAVAA
ncbi:MAG: hypothetical protein WA892_13270 [Ornithinimicrobium sp.]